jgi:cysteine desulfurase
LILLDQEGVCASSGSACLADSDEPSHVVKAMKPESSASRKMIRFSLGAGTRREDITAAVSAVNKQPRCSGLESASIVRYKAGWRI